MAFSRRSFFKRLATAVAIVALAPEIAFKPKREPEIALTPYWTQSERWTACYSDAYQEFLVMTVSKVSPVGPAILPFVRAPKEAA